VKYWVGRNSLIVIDGFEWGSIRTLATRLELAEGTIANKIAEKGLKSQKCKDAKGAVWDFYRLDDVRSACADLLGVKNKAGRDGFFVADGHTWGTKERIVALIKVSKNLLMKRIARNKLRPRKGRNRNGVVRGFYRLDQVKEACSDLILRKKLGRAGRDDFFEAGGYKWGTPASLARQIGTTFWKVKKVIRTKRLRSREGYDRLRHRFLFYRLDQTSAAYADLFQNRKDKA